MRPDCNILPEVMDEPEEPTAAGDVNFQASRNLENVQNTPQTSNPENEHCNILPEVMDEPEEPAAAGDVDFQVSRNLENAQNTPQSDSCPNPCGLGIPFDVCCGAAAACC